MKKERDELVEEFLLSLSARDKLLILLYSAGLDWRILPWEVVFIYSILLTQSEILVFDSKLETNSWPLYGDILSAAIRDLIGSEYLIVFHYYPSDSSEKASISHILISPKGKERALKIINDFSGITEVISGIQKVLSFFEDFKWEELLDLTNRKKT